MNRLNRQAEAKHIAKMLSTPIPASLDPSPTAHLNILEALSILISADSISRNPMLVQLLKANWSKACQWVYLFIQTYAFSEIPETLCTQVMSLGRNILAASEILALEFGQVGDREKAYASTPGLLPLLVKLSVHLNATQSSHFVPIFMTLMTTMVEENMIVIFLSISDYNIPLNAIRYLVMLNQRLLGSNIRSGFDTMPFFVALRYIQILVSGNDQHFLHPLLEHGLVKWLGRTMFDLASLPNRASLASMDREGLLLCLELCCHMSKGSWSHGHMWLVDSLDNKIVLSMWNALHLVDKDHDLVKLCAEALLAMMPLLVFRSVVIRCIPKLEGLRKRGLEAHIIDRNHPFRAAFIQVIRSASLFADSRRHFERESGCVNLNYRLSPYDKALIKHSLKPYFSNYRRKLLHEKARAEIGTNPRQNAIIACVDYRLYPAQVTPQTAKEALKALSVILETCKHGEDKRRELLEEWKRVDMKKEIVVVVFHPGTGCHAVLIYRIELLD
ncbi:hypothetical protein VNI00_009404 [Paramarasmius palmivorus]|uniref:Uncharacterized protein n=1 Tax=Paramarasmius palmivorus TaxID=297713 RepID=A0AAW0CRM6_9AGAR